MKKNNILKRIIGTVALPGAMFLVMMIFCFSNGKMYFGTLAMWKTLIVKVALAAACAMGIGLQFRCGRFDFSGGAIMLIASIVAGNVAKNAGSNILLFSVLSIGICVGLSVIVALVYAYGRMPIVIVTIGMALLYESVTCLMFNGRGVNLTTSLSLRKFVTYPGVLIPFIGAIIVYLVFEYLSKSGKQSSLLANNQQVAVNIGINEVRNVIVSYVYSGLIFGFATMIYAANDLHGASFVTMSTVGALFTNILPVFIGLMLAEYCGNTIGTVMGALTLSLMSYGLSAVLNNEMGSAVSTVCTGVFILLINVASSRGRELIKLIGTVFVGGCKSKGVQKQ